MHECAFGQRFGIRVRRKHLCSFHFPAGSVQGFFSQLDTWYVAQTRERDGVQFGRRGEIFFLDCQHCRGFRVRLDPFGALQQGARCSSSGIGIGVHPFAVRYDLAAILVFVRRVHYLVGNIPYLLLRD